MNVTYKDAKPFVFEMTIDPAEALLLGQTRHGKVRVEIDPSELTPEEREVAAEMIRQGAKELPAGTWKSPSGGTVYLDTDDWARLGGRRRYGQITLAEIKEALATTRRVFDLGKARFAEEETRKRSEKEELEAKDEEEYRLFRGALLELSPDAFAGHTGGVYFSSEARERLGSRLSLRSPGTVFSHYGTKAQKRGDAELVLAIQRVHARAHELNERRIEREALYNEAKERAEKETKEARRLTIERLVREHGTYEQNVRREAGRLPEEEALAVCRKVLLPLDLPKFERLRKSELEYGQYDAEFDKGTLVELSAEQYALVEWVKKLLPDAEVRIDWHAVSSSEEKVERNSLYVSRTVDGLTVSRRYAAPDTPEFDEA